METKVYYRIGTEWFSSEVPRVDEWIQSNPHLDEVVKDSDLSAAERTRYEEYEVAQSERKRKQGKRDRILKIADRDTQLQMIFDCLAKLQLNGIDISTEVSSFLGKRAQVK